VIFNKGLILPPPLNYLHFEDLQHDDDDDDEDDDDDGLPVVVAVPDKAQAFAVYIYIYCPFPRCQQYSTMKFPNPGSSKW
jgi:hypothetical protein